MKDKVKAMCPFCRKKESTVDKNNPLLVNCEACGKFELSKEAHRYIEKEYSDAEGDLGGMFQIMKNCSLLSGITREDTDKRECANEGGVIKIENKEQIDKLINSDMVPKNIFEQMDKILLFLERRQKLHSFFTYIPEIPVREKTDWSTGYCPPPPSPSFFDILDKMSKKKYIELKEDSDKDRIFRGAAIRRYEILLTGLERIKELEDKSEQQETGKEESDWLEWDGLKFNKTTGDASYGKLKTHFTPESQNHLVLKALMEKRGNPLLHREIVSILWPNTKEKYQYYKTNIATVIRNIKSKLKMGAKKQNKDLITGKGVGGYKLIAPSKSK